MISSPLRYFTAKFLVFNMHFFLGTPLVSICRCFSWNKSWIFNTYGCHQKVNLCIQLAASDIEGTVWSCYDDFFCHGILDFSIPQPIRTGSDFFPNYRMKGYGPIFFDVVCYFVQVVWNMFSDSQITWNQGLSTKVPSWPQDVSTQTGYRHHETDAQTWGARGGGVDQMGVQKH